MKRYAFILAACMLAATASAQQGNTRQECQRRCHNVDASPKKAAHERRLQDILDRKKAETDAAKRTALAQAESDERERFEDEQERMCRRICQSLREE